jgi:superfamily I DNA/RNA helicase
MSCCSRNEPLRKHYQERFRYILVDEFQDTNRLQYSLAATAGRWRRQGFRGG